MIYADGRTRSFRVPLPQGSARTRHRPLRMGRYSAAVHRAHLKKAGLRRLFSSRSPDYGWPNRPIGGCLVAAPGTVGKSTDRVSYNPSIVTPLQRRRSSVEDKRPALLSRDGRSASGRRTSDGIPSTPRFHLRWPRTGQARSRRSFLVIRYGMSIALALWNDRA